MIHPILRSATNIAQIPERRGTASKNREVPVPSASLLLILSDRRWCLSLFDNSDVLPPRSLLCATKRSWESRNRRIHWLLTDFWFWARRPANNAPIADINLVGESERSISGNSATFVGFSRIQNAMDGLGTAFFVCEGLPPILRAVSGRNNPVPYLRSH
jgi:hypothetical protein